MNSKSEIRLKSESIISTFMVLPTIIYLVGSLFKIFILIGSGESMERVRE